MKSIKVKILGPVAVLAVLVLVTSAFSILGAGNIEKKGRVISDEYLATIQDVSAMSKNTQTLMRLSYNYILAQGDAAEKKVEISISQTKQTLENQMADFSNTLTPEETEAFQKFQSDYQAYLSKYNAMVKYVQTNQNENASIVANNDLVEMSSQIETDLENMIELESSLADQAVANMESAYASSMGVGIVCLLLGIVALVAAIIISNRMVVKPVVAANKKLGEIVSLIEEHKGDLTMRVESGYQDEIGALADGINLFLDKLQSTMGVIVSGTQNLTRVVNMVTENVSASNDNAQDVSSAMEELSATMQEIAATVQTVTENTESISGEVNDIADRTGQMNTYSKEMQERADTLAKNANENKVQTDAMVGNIVGTLKQAIEESRSVEKVNELTGEILNISSQTNLLALNASIEAARAGDAGKGFAVVADEIRQLADSSRDTANNIQAINEHVTKAVHALIDNSNAMIAFIEETVLPDYGTYADSGEQYNEDASYVSEVMNEFTEKTENLKNIMNNVVESIEGIAKAVEESANAVTSSAMSTGSLVEDMHTINEQMGSSKETVESLKAEADVFKKF